MPSSRPTALDFHRYIFSDNFATTLAYDTTRGGVQDAFVVKLNSLGNSRDYATYLGGSGGDFGYGIAIDGSGKAYVTGYTLSTDFPTTAGAFQGTNAGYDDAFVVKLDSAGGNLLYATYLGGDVTDRAYGIAVDGSGNAYITGYSYSANFPTAPGAYQPNRVGAVDAFVVKLNGAGGRDYATYLGGGPAGGGGGGTYGNGIAVDASGNAYITGYTAYADFPTTIDAYQRSKPGQDDAFLAKLNVGGDILIYSTYLGGASDDRGYGIAVDAVGNAHVTGGTLSTNFPTTAGVYQGGNAGSWDAFLAKIGPGGVAPPSIPPQPPAPPIPPAVVMEMFWKLVRVPVDPSWLAQWAKQLAWSSPAEVVRQIQSTPEYRDTLVRWAYRKTFRRQPKAREWQRGMTLLTQGGSLQSLMANLLAQVDEAHVLMGMAASLGRPAQEVEQEFVQGMRKGGSQEKGVLRILNSPTGRLWVAQRYWKEYASRPATKAELRSLGLLQAGLSWQEMEAAVLLASTYPSQVS